MWVSIALLFVKVEILCIEKDAVLRKVNQKKSEEKQVTGCMYGMTWYGNQKT